ncbi:MAG: two pore domain potassium channel family protein [Dermatophilaceae bacterium]
MSASLELWPSAPRGRTPTRWHRLQRNVRELPSALLLFVQLGFLLIYPFIEKELIGPWGKAGFGVLALVVLYLAIRVVRASPVLTWVAALIGVPVVLLTLAEAIWTESTAIAFSSALLHAMFYFYVGYGLVRYMFADNWVSKDELYATGATFTVLAWAYAYLYLTAQFVWPGSFTISGGVGDSARSWFELLGLSVANMTGTGLSDIIAISPHARSFVSLQQITGTLYVAMVVARLVGLTIVRFGR